MSLTDITKRAFAGLLLAGSISLSSANAFAQSFINSRFMYIDEEKTGFNVQRNIHIADGTGDTKLTENEYVIDAAWSPDGKNVAYSKRDGLYVMNLNDKSELNIFTTDNHFINKPTWSPDGRRIGFSANISGSYGIFSVDALGSDLRTIIDTPNDELYPDWSPDNKLVAYSVLNGADVGSFMSISVVDTSNSRVRQLTKGPLDMMAEWSPNGKYVAFRRDDASSNLHGRIFRVNSIDGSGLIQLGNPDYENFFPVFSPDGSLITYSRTKDWNLFEAVVSSVDGSNIQVVKLPNVSSGYHSLQFDPIIAPNQSPVITVQGVPTTDEGKPLSLEIKVTDADNDPTTITIPNLPAGAILDRNLLIWTPSYNQSGTYPATITASDGTNITTYNLKITVNDTQKSPTDINKDSITDIEDFIRVANKYGTIIPKGQKLAEDIDGNGRVDYRDLMAVLKNLWQTAAPTNNLSIGKTKNPDDDLNQVYHAFLTAEQADTEKTPNFYQAKHDIERLFESQKPATRLLQNFPNPFNPETWIPYQLAENATRVEVGIYNAQGELVRMFDVGEKSKGVYADRNSAVYWDGRNMDGEKIGSGLYYLQLRVYDGLRLVTTNTRRILEIK